VLIKVAAQAIPTYPMRVFELPRDLCSFNQSSIINFWWGHSKEGRKIHWIRDERLHDKKEDGAPGFYDLDSFNKLFLPNNSGGFSSPLPLWSVDYYKLSTIPTVLYMMWLQDTDLPSLRGVSLVSESLSPKASLVGR